MEIDSALIEAAAHFPVATAPELRAYRQAVASGDADEIEGCAYRLAERIGICSE